LVCWLWGKQGGGAAGRGARGKQISLTGFTGGLWVFRASEMSHLALLLLAVINIIFDVSVPPEIGAQIK
jgi:hypothetical protein